MIPLLIGGGARLISKVVLSAAGDATTTVPAGATFCVAKLWGSGGGAHSSSNGSDYGYAQGGPGAFVAGGFTVTAAQDILTHIGDVLATANSRGGDYTALRRGGDISSQPRMVAAGGGAAGLFNSGDTTFGGEGGAGTGGVGTSLNAPSVSAIATGGTQTAGGTGYATDGAFLGHGFNAGDSNSFYGGEGGGYWSGGTGYAGGGGASFTDATTLYPIMKAGEAPGTPSQTYRRLPGGSSDVDYDGSAGRGANHYRHGATDTFNGAGRGRIVLAFYDFDPIISGVVALT